MDGQVAPPFDPHARTRIEEVAAALLDLCGRLETRVDALTHRTELLEQTLDELTGAPRG